MTRTYLKSSSSMLVKKPPENDSKVSQNKIKCSNFILPVEGGGSFSTRYSN